MTTLFINPKRICALSIACALLFILAACAPVFADDVSAKPVALLVVQPEQKSGADVPPTLGLKPGEKILVASASSPDKTVALSAVPKGIVLEGPPAGRSSGDAKLARNLALAGLLLIPLDKSLVKSMSRADDPENAGAAVEFVNDFGDKKILLPVIAGLYLTGDKGTAGDALTALANAAIITEGLKRATGRVRPINSSDEGRFHGPGSPKEYQSFPSGHTSAAFAVATVLAKRHPKQKWLYYGLASAVGYARIQKSAHFPSDVLVGAGIGIYAGSNAVDRSGGLFSIRF